MSTWHEFEAYKAQRIADEEAKLEAFRQRRTPVLERLRRFVDSIPESERYPRHISFFSQALRPRHHGRYAAQYEVADALRQLGFTRVRAWDKPEQGFRTLWHFPPKPGA